nr:hypothetical protein [Xylanimonas allomyrinae]
MLTSTTGSVETTGTGAGARVCPIGGSCVLSVVWPAVMRSHGQEDAVGEEVEPGASVHLAFEHLGARVDAFGAPVVMREGDRCDDRVLVLPEAADERVQGGQSR